MNSLIYHVGSIGWYREGHSMNNPRSRCGVPYIRTNSTVNNLAGYPASVCRSTLLTFMLILGVTAAGAHGDSLRFRRIDVDDGLSQSMVTSIAQDRRGFIWMGTTDGLNRYDGYTFSVFRARPDHSGFLMTSFILNIYEARDGMLWIGTYGGGLVRYDPVGGTSVTYRADKVAHGGLCGNGVGPVCEDQSGNLWIGTSEGLNRFNRSTGAFSRFVHDPHNPASLSNNGIWVIFTDKAGTVWIGTENGLNRFVGDKEGFVRYYHDPDTASSISSSDVRAICEDGAGAMWVGTLNGLNLFDRSRGMFTRFQHDGKNPHSLPDNIVFAVHEDRSGRLWVGTSEGLGILDRKTGSFQVYRHDEFDPESLGDDQVRRIFEDRAGTLWFATAKGVSLYDNRMSRFTLWRRDPSDENSIRHNLVHALLEDRDGYLWIGTDRGGLSRYDRSRDLFTHFRHNPADTRSIPTNWITSLVQDRTGRIWVGTGEGLCRMDMAGRGFVRFVHDPANPRSLASNWVLGIYEDRSGSLWIGTGEGLDLFEGTGRFVHFRRDPADPNSLPGDIVRTIIEDREGYLWVGTNSGLARMDRKQNRWTSFVQDDKVPSSISDNRILSLFEDSSGNLWIGTAGGLNRYDRSRNVFIHYGVADGFPSETINSILEDGRGYLWIGSNRGIVRFDPLTRSCRNFDVSDGLQAAEFRPGSCVKTRDGHMFFGGVRGFNGFRPEDLVGRIPPSPVVITSVKKFNIPISPTGDPDAGEIVLSHKDRFVSFEFAVLDYICPQKNQYSYTLEGVDSRWIFCGTRRFASYTNIPPGRYVFRVRGTNGDGVWNESGPALTVRIVPPFWLTWWFRISVIFIVAAAIYGAHYIRMRVISNRNRMLENEVDRRTGELQRLTEQLGEERARFKMLLDGLPVIVFLHATDGSIRYANRLFRETFGEPDMISCVKTPDEKSPICADCRRMTVLCPGDDGGQREWTSPDGRVFEVYEYPFADGETGGLVLRLVLDITDRKRAEREFLNREKVRAALATAGAATHELNQPLQIISGYCEILGEQMDRDDPNGHIIRKIEEQVIRMSEISKRMNKVIRYETKEYFNGMPILDIYKSSE